MKLFEKTGKGLCERQFSFPKSQSLQGGLCGIADPREQQTQLA